MRGLGVGLGVKGVRVRVRVRVKPSLDLRGDRAGGLAPPGEPELLELRHGSIHKDTADGVKEG